MHYKKQWRSESNGLIYQSAERKQLATQNPVTH